MVHITGGGFYENIPRILPQGLNAFIDGEFPVLPVFKWMKEKADLSEREMFTTFNCGTGFMLIVPNDQADKIIENSDRYYVGKIVKSDSDQRVEITRNHF
jgi:phosphoribosylformylglycinamidine cyclo-ligase